MDNVAEVAKSVFSGIWDVCLHTDFPGLDVSIAAVLVALLLIRFSIKVFGYLTGFGLSGSDYGRAANMLEKTKRDYKRTKRLNAERAGKSSNGSYVYNGKGVT